MAKYTKLSEKITSAKIRQFVLGSNIRPIGPEDDFPSWIWPYIQKAVKAGKIKLDAKKKTLMIPKDADIDDYSLPVIGFLAKAGVSFPGVTLAKLPDNYFTLLKGALDSKLIDQYGKVDPDSLHDVPRPLWPYVRVKGRLGNILSKVGKYDPENFHDFAPGILPKI